MIMWLTGLFGAWEGITLLRRWFRPLLFVSFMALTPDPDGHKFAACTVLPRRPPKNADDVDALMDAIIADGTYAEGTTIVPITWRVM